MIKGVVFDVGATIVDFPSVDSAEAETGIKKVADVVANWLPIDTAGFCRELSLAIRTSPKQGPDFRQVNTYRDVIAEIVKKYAPKATPKDICSLEREFVHSMLSGISPVDGMIEVICLLGGRTRVAVASNTRSHYLIRAALEQTGVLKFFSPFVTSVSCGYRKPGPRIFEEVLSAWSVQPEHVVMIGDKLDRDIEGAKTLGIRTIWFNRSHELPSILPDATATKSSDIVSILKMWGLNNA